MIQVQNLYLKFGDKVLFEDASFSLAPGEKVGLTGRNGAGKTTLLKIIHGDLLPDEGDVILPRNYKVGFLSQHLEEMEDIPLIQETSKALSELDDIEKNMETVQNELTERTDYTSEAYMDLVNKLDSLTNQYNLMDGSKKRGNVERILKGLGFTDDDMQKTVSTFSGGWKMRITLAKILLTEPEILLLDEPTNHLDINSILWLEDWLKQSQGILIVISHDVQFLDNVTSRTLEVEHGSIFDYPVSYSKYKVQRAERREKLLAAYKNQQKKIEEKERVIEKFRAKANKARMAQSMIKQLDRIERIELDEGDSSTIKLHFLEAPRSGRVVVEGKNIVKSFGNKEVLKNVDLLIERGEKVAFVGQNGQGKTTLVKLILNELKTTSGTIELGYNVSPGYYAQDQAAKLNPDRTILETVEDIAPREWMPKVRGLLGALLFSGEDVDKKISVLSGGEKARVALAELLMFPYNFLLLDEPTNHLDVQSKEILKEALKKFDGTLLIVSHDRDFLDGLVDRTVEFREHKLVNHLGTFKEFLEKRKTEDMRDIEFAAKGKSKETSSDNTLSNKEIYLQRKEIQKKISYVEKDIEKLETEINKIEEEMHDPEFYMQANATELTKKHGLLKENIEKLTGEWEILVEELDSIEN